MSLSQDSMSLSQQALEWAHKYTGVDPDDQWETVVQVLSAVKDDPLFEHAKAMLLPIHRYLARADEGVPRDTSCQTSFQCLLLFILQRLSELNYRRYMDCCYARIQGDEDEPTFAYERVCTIRAFILRETNKETHPDQWKNMTNPKDNLEILTRHLMNVEHVEFKMLTVDERYISFRNGTYSVADNVFWPHDRTAEWPSFAADVQRDRRAQGWPPDYALVAPHSGICCASYIDRKFRLVDDSNKSALDNIRTMLTGVGIPADAHGWLFALLGRLLFPINELDKWCVMPFFKTSEAADNAAFLTIKTSFEAIVGADAVSQVASGVNTQHALETLMGARVCGILLREHLPLEQGDWQSALSGEYVCINPRAPNRTSFSYKWRSPMFAAGPCIGYKNDAGTVDRRVVMFDVSKGTVEDFRALTAAINENIDLWSQTIVDAYLTVVHENASRDIWASGVLPAVFHKSRDALRELITPLSSCAKSSLFNLDPQSFMPLADFKDIYYGFRQRRGLLSQRWIRDHWHATFLDLNLTIERSQREYRGVRSTTDWLIGIDAIVNSHGQSLIVTPEMVDQLEADKMRLDCELQNITEKVDVARQLCTIEDDINRLKTLRTNLRHKYESMLD